MKYGYNILREEIGLRTRSILQEICSEKKIIIIRGNVRSNHIHILVESPSYYSPSKIAQFLKGKSSYRLQREFPLLKKRYWGQHIWSRGYFCSTFGSITEEQMKAYVEGQIDKPDNFKVWDDGSGLQTDLSVSLKEPLGS